MSNKVKCKTAIIVLHNICNVFLDITSEYRVCIIKPLMHLTACAFITCVVGLFTVQIGYPILNLAWDCSSENNIDVKSVSWFLGNSEELGFNVIVIVDLCICKLFWKTKATLSEYFARLTCPLWDFWMITVWNLSKQGSTLVDIIFDN